MEPTLDELKAWIGRSETVHDSIGPTPVRALTATLDHPAAPLGRGTPLPPLWHWLYFLPLHRQSEIGPDGHAKRGGFLPPVPLPRRMWAGSQFEFRAPLRVGDAVRAHLDHRRRDDQGRAAAARWCSSRCATSCAATARPSRRWSSSTTSSTATRSSPATSTPPPQAAPTGARLAARDRARRRAAVPLLGAHLQRPPHPLRPPLRHRGRGLPGPDRARPADRHAADGPAAPPAAGCRGGGFRFKAVRPTFDLHPFRVNGAPQADGKTVRLWAQDHEGWLTMDATARCAEPRTPDHAAAARASPSSRWNTPSPRRSRRASSPTSARASSRSSAPAAATSPAATTSACAAWPRTSSGPTAPRRA